MSWVYFAALVVFLYNFWAGAQLGEDFTEMFTEGCLSAIFIVGCGVCILRLVTVFTGTVFTV